MSVVGFGAVLMAIWLLLWGSISVANIVSGLAMIAVVLLVLPDTRFAARTPSIRPLALLRLIGRILADLLRANIAVSKEILTRDSAIHSGVIEVPLPFCSDALLTFVADVLALSPGMMAIEVTRDPGVIWVHVLHLDDVEKTRDEVLSLADLAVRAFGSDEAIASFGSRGPASDVREAES